MDDLLDNDIRQGETFKLETQTNKTFEQAYFDAKTNFHSQPTIQKEKQELINKLLNPVFNSNIKKRQIK